MILRSLLLVALMIGLCLTVGLPVAGKAQQAPAAPPAAASAAASADQSYILGPGDVIEVSVLGRTDFTTRARIGQDGTIQLPFLGVVPAGNVTGRELSDQVSRKLETGGYFSHPIVKVDIVSYASRYVIVLGQVGTPGLVPVDRPYRLSEILARVGGVKETGANYVVLRPEKGTEQRLPIADLATGDVSQDPYVSPGDKIYSPPAELFYVSGQVKAPGAYALLPGMTVSMAIARGGGLTESGSMKALKLTRHGVSTGHVDLNAKVEPGDVVNVGESLF
jgi:polysaccharide export outer membrane protein